MTPISFLAYTYITLLLSPFPSIQSLISRTSTPDATRVNASATILDHDGLDITSSFKFMVYREPVYHEQTGRLSGNETGNDLHDRTTQFAQLVNACPRNETFVSSHCDPEAGGEDAMRKYIYTCRRTTVQYDQATGMVTGLRPVYRIRHGYCQPSEICITGRRPRLMASCVQYWVFDDWTLDKDGQIKPMLGGSVFSLDDLTIYTAASESDQSTPLELDKFSLDAENVEQGLVQSTKCRDCVELKTESLKPNIDTLKLEATLLNVGAATGILWLAFMSG